jgi:hypothetical protein
LLLLERPEGDIMVDSSAYRDLSLTARLAVALHCFSRYCETKGLRHLSINAFIDDLWEFPIVEHDRWEDWKNNHPPHPPLVSTALGDPWPAGFEGFLRAQAVSATEFRRLTSSLAEIVFSSFYGAADDDFSLKCLMDVLTMASDCGINPPPAGAFSASQFIDRGGWGKPMTATDRDAGRSIKW